MYVLCDSNRVIILPVLDLLERETDTPRQQRTNGGGISLENLCSRQSAVLGLSVDVERTIEKYGFLETVRDRTFFFNGFQYTNNFRIGVGGSVTARWMFRFQNLLVVRTVFELKICIF